MLYYVVGGHIAPHLCQIPHPPTGHMASAGSRAGIHWSATVSFFCVDAWVRSISLYIGTSSPCNCDIRATPAIFSGSEAESERIKCSRCAISSSNMNAIWASFWNASSFFSMAEPFSSNRNCSLFFVASTPCMEPNDRSSVTVSKLKIVVFACFAVTVYTYTLRYIRRSI